MYSNRIHVCSKLFWGVFYFVFNFFILILQITKLLIHVTTILTLNMNFCLFIFGSELGLFLKKEVIYILQCIIPRIEELLAINVDKAGAFTDMVIFNNYIYSRRLFPFLSLF